MTQEGRDGRYHFIFEDEKCIVDDSAKAEFENLRKDTLTFIWLSTAELVAVICIEDPLREEAADAIRQLKEAGITKVVIDERATANELQQSSLSVLVSERILFRSCFRKTRPASFRENGKTEPKPLSSETGTTILRLFRQRMLALLSVMAQSWLVKLPTSPLAQIICMNW